MKRRSSFFLIAVMALPLLIVSTNISCAQEKREAEVLQRQHEKEGASETKTSRSALAQEKEVRGDIQYYMGIGNRSKEQRRQDLAKVRWGDNITQEEKASLVVFLEDERSEFVLYPGSPVLKSDLDTDGQDEFVLNAVVRNPTRSHYGAVALVLARKGTRFEILFQLKPEPWPWFTTDWHFAVVDFDKDGFNDLVEYKEIEAYGESPSISAMVYKNQGMKNFPRVYLKAIHSYLQFEDLDNDGRLELLEPVMGVERKGLLSPPEKLWINIYNWTGTEFVDSSDRYLDFYLTKEAEYKEEIARWRKENSALSPSMISIYEEYLYKIKFLKSRHQSVQ